MGDGAHGGAEWVCGIPVGIASRQCHRFSNCRPRAGADNRRAALVPVGWHMWGFHNFLGFCLGSKPPPAVESTGVLVGINRDAGCLHRGILNHLQHGELDRPVVALPRHDLFVLPQDTRNVAGRKCAGCEPDRGRGTLSGTSGCIWSTHVGARVIRADRIN